MTKAKLIRITTIPLSLDKLLEGQLQFMSDYYQVTAISSDENYLKKVGDREGVATFTLEMTRKITPIKDAIAIAKLTYYFLKVKPDIVHSHTPKAGLVAMTAAFFARVPIRLHTVAGLPLLETSGLKRKLLEWVDRITYAFATKVYPNSKGLEDIMLQHRYCPSKKMKVLGNGSSNGINTLFFSKTHFSPQKLKQLQAELGISENDFVYVFVGRLVADKGINELITAFDDLIQSHENKLPKNCKLLLVGPLEPELDPLKQQTLELIASNPQIISVGYQPDVRPYLALAHVLTFPSYREGFPNVVMQAGAMELPVIATNINGCNEIISSRINGLLIPTKDTVALEKAMVLVLSDESLYQQLKDNARKLITERYNQQVVWEAVLAEYERLEEQIIAKAK